MKVCFWFFYQIVCIYKLWLNYRSIEVTDILHSRGLQTNFSDKKCFYLQSSIVFLITIDLGIQQTIFSKPKAFGEQECMT